MSSSAAETINFLRLRRCTAELWSARQSFNDDRFPKFYEISKGIYVNRSDAVQMLSARAKYTLLLPDGALHGWSATIVCHLRGNSSACVVQMPGNSQCPLLVMGFQSPERYPSAEKGRVAMSRAVNVLREFLQQAMQCAGDQVPVLIFR
ncbi:hypothetical protein PoB_001183900 [Plakobranchus ocellatus]|uniref:Uncharacterized protein n=1 Tax=Plakobranchus ocellatus TaxID=259542 RepID=A0AAV3YQK3_9GAST|nr:hypothetical protein PoB_001183900 [Plakobranchus ocellatus]